MSRPLVVLILFFQPVLSISDFERFLIRERWLPTSEENEIFKTKTIAGVSPECQTDYTRWMTDLAVFAKDFNECFIQQSPKCNNETKAELKKNIYALKQLDAFGRLPPGVLDIDLTQSGSETECKEVSKHYYKTHYCFVSSAFGKNASCDSATGTTLTTKRAVCMPASCSEQDILLIWNSTHHLMPFTHCGVECVPETGHINTFFWIFVIFLAVLIGLCVFASVVDFVRDSYLNRQAKEAEHLCLRLLLVFSFYTNGHAILDTTPAREGHLKSLDCIRFFSMVWVVTGHVSTLWLHSDTLQPAFHLMKPIAADIIGSAVFSVDTFFVLSGMLVSYMFFKQMSRMPQLIKNPATWILFYVHRYLRLTPPYMLFIGFYIAFTPLIVGQNAMLFGNAEEVDLCIKYWWRNLIYINNFEPEDTCYGISWYLSADTQMYLAAPVFLVALFINHWIGLAVIISAISGSVGLTFYWIFHDDLAANLIRAGAKTEDFHIKLYLAPWIRITPYLVGMYVGYLLVKFPKNKRPRLHVLLPIIGWICTIGIALACVFGPYKYLAFETNWSKFTSAFYYSFSRIGWGIFICWTVAANFYGWGGPIAAFMDHPLWQPLGRLSYTAYLVHYFVITYFINLFDRPLHFTSFLAQFQTFTIPITIMAYCFAFVWSCTCELPFLKLEKIAVDSLMGSRGPRVKPEEKIVESWEDEKPKLEIEEIVEKL